MVVVRRQLVILVMRTTVKKLQLIAFRNNAKTLQRGSLHTTVACSQPAWTR